MSQLKFPIFLLFCSFFVIIVAPDVDPPTINPILNTTTTTTTTTTSTTTEAPEISTTPIEFTCPANCTCTEAKKEIHPKHQCCPMGYFNNYWNPCLMGHRPHERFYRQNNMQQYANNKYRTCNKGYSFYQGKCIRRERDVIISCEFPQTELPCCHIEFPKKCRKSPWGDNCFASTYYYCGEMCDRKDNLSEEDLNKLVKNQMNHQHWQSHGKLVIGSCF